MDPTDILFVISSLGATVRVQQAQIEKLQAENAQLRAEQQEACESTPER